MQLTGFAGVLFSTLSCSVSLDPSSPGPSRSITSALRYGADPIAPGIGQDVQVITALFTSNAGSTSYVEINLAKVLALLNPDDPTPRTLTASILTTGPSTYTTVQTQAYVGNWRYQSQSQIVVDFIIPTPGWKQTATTTLKSAAVVTANSSFTNLNTGQRDVLPLVTVYWDGSQRASSTATFGWKHRIGTGQTIMNTGTEPLINQPYQLGPIDTKTLVTAGQMQADCDDLRVFCQGRELSRNLIGPNTLGTLIWIVLPTVAPWQAITLDLMTNNPTATNPPTLTFGVDLPGMDISGQSFNPTSSAATTATLTAAGWETDQWAGATVIVLRSAGTGIDLVRRVVSNTTTTITVDRSWGTVPGGTDTLSITKSGMTGTGGIATSGTTTTIVDSFQAWNTNEWVGATVYLRDLSFPTTFYTSTVTANTATQLTFSPAFALAAANPDTYNVWRANGQRVWDVRTPPKTTPYSGLWQANKIQAPPTRIDFDAPASWYRFTSQRNDDAYSQPRYDSFLVGAGDYDHAPLMHIRRARKGKGGDQTEIGVADAIGVSTPFPANGIWFGYTIRNAKKAGSGSPGEGMAEARFMSQQAGGESWSTFLRDVAVHDTTATVSPAWYQLSSSTNRVAMTLVPNAADKIQDTDNNTAELRHSGNYITLAVDPTAVITQSVDFFLTAPTVVAVYDVDLLIRTGGASATRPYEQIRIGGAAHRVFLAATDERISVDCATHIVSLTTDAGVFIRRIPYAVQPQEVVTDADGSARTIVTARWLPVPPSSIDAANIYYTDPSGAGWGQVGLSVIGTLGYWT